MYANLGLIILGAAIVIAAQWAWKKYGAAVVGKVKDKIKN